MASFRIVPSRFATILRAVPLIVGVLMAFAVAPAGAAPTETARAANDIGPPAIVIDADFVPVQAVGYVVYVPHNHEMLAMDAASGSIRAVIPAPPRPTHTQSTGWAALTAGSVSVPAFGVVLLALLFIAMVGIIFLRRAARQHLDPPDLKTGGNQFEARCVSG